MVFLSVGFETTTPAGCLSVRKAKEDGLVNYSMLIANKTMPQAAVSIHQNSYQDAQIHGAQVFYYSHSEEGKRMAEVMQKALLKADEENTRQAKANDTYYLLKRTEVPTIIVECGFLSNPEEAAKLVSPKYQEKLAEAIAEGILACMEN